MLDIELLHQNVQKINNGERIGYRCGATTTYQHLLMGEVWLGSRDNQYVFIGLNRNHVNMVCLKFLAMLNEDQQGSEYPKKDIRVMHANGWYHVIVDSQFFTFVDYIKAREPNFWAGKDIARIFIDLNDRRDDIRPEILAAAIAHGADIL